MSRSDRTRNCPNCGALGNVSPYVKACFPAIYSASCDVCKIKWEYSLMPVKRPEYNHTYETYKENS